MQKKLIDPWRTVLNDIDQKLAKVVFLSHFNQNEAHQKFEDRQGTDHQTQNDRQVNAQQDWYDHQGQKRL